MNGITSMQRSSTSYADYGKFASGKKVNRAADGAAELAIIQKQETQTRSYKAGENNIGAAKDMLNVADGAMSGITDYLQKIRELGVRASNTATITDAERTSIQAQIEQYKQGISDIAKQTSFNTKPLLDGTSQKYNIMTDATGNGMEITTADATLQALGIADFDVTKDFDLTQVDDALARVSAGRSGMGAQSNALEYAYRYSTNTRLNVTAGKSRLEDLDYGQAVSEQKKKQTLQQYAFFMQKKQMEQGKEIFLRIHQSYLINSRYIYWMDGNTVRTQDGREFSVSGSCREQAKTAYRMYRNQ